MSRNYDFSLAAGIGSARLIQAIGTRCKLLAATGPMEVRTDQGAVYSLLPGQGFNMPAGEAFREIFLANKQAGAVSGTIFVGDETFIDDRITGDVSIIDNAAAKTSAGRQYIGSAFTPALGAGVWGILGLRAGASAVAIRRLTISSTTAGQMLWGCMTGTPTANYNAGLGAMQNKAFGQAASLAVRWSATGAAASPTVGELPGLQVFAQVNCTANVDNMLFDSENTPILLQPNNSIWVFGGTANRDLIVTFDMEEMA